MRVLAEPRHWPLKYRGGAVADHPAVAPMDDARARAGQLDRQGGQFQDGEFFGITQIDWADHLIRRIDEPHQAIDQINVTERAGLQAIAEYCDVAAEQRLDNKVRAFAKLSVKIFHRR